MHAEIMMAGIHPMVHEKPMDDFRLARDVLAIDAYVTTSSEYWVNFYCVLSSLKPPRETSRSPHRSTDLRNWGTRD
jgi:hypothetical protein